MSWVIVWGRGNQGRRVQQSASPDAAEVGLVRTENGQWGLADVCL